MDRPDPDATRRPFHVHWVAGGGGGGDSLTGLRRALAASPVVALDAEWKPAARSASANAGGGVALPSFPPVSLLQIATYSGPLRDDSRRAEVFLLDLQSLRHSEVYDLIRCLFEDSNVLKLGFRFKQDLVYLSSTFCSHGCEPGLDKVEPFIDISTIYHHLQIKFPGKRMSKDNRSLASICKELLGVHLSKELQCSDWSCRPLSEEQKAYAAADAYYLLEMFSIFYEKILEDNSLSAIFSHASNDMLGLKEVIENKCGQSDDVVRRKFCEAQNMIKDSQHMSPLHPHVGGAFTLSMFLLDESLFKVVQRYGDRIVLKESDRKPKAAKRTKRKQFSNNPKHQDFLEDVNDLQFKPSWDASSGEDGCPRFLCDVMVEGLAKHLRCVGIDAAVPSSKKPDPRELIDKAQREKRVLLTRDAKMLRYQYLLKTPVYKVKSLLKNDQLLEVIEAFKLKISEDQLMSRCTKCNGQFIQKPLTTEEAITAAKGFQIIPNCLFNRNIEFWQCVDCSQLYWEGTQYHNAVQKFIDVCKLNE